MRLAAATKVQVKVGSSSSSGSSKITRPPPHWLAARASAARWRLGSPAFRHATTAHASLASLRNRVLHPVLVFIPAALVAVAGANAGAVAVAVEGLAGDDSTRSGWLASVVVHRPCRRLGAGDGRGGRGGGGSGRGGRERGRGRGGGSRRGGSRRGGRGSRLSLSSRERRRSSGWLGWAYDGLWARARHRVLLLLLP